MIKTYWIGIKIDVHALELWYKIMYKFHENWIRDSSVLEWILSAIVQQFSAYNIVEELKSGSNIEVK